MLAQAGEIPVQILDPLHVRLDPFLLEPVVELCLIDAMTRRFVSMREVGYV